MADPTATDRVQPTGVPLEDGYQSLITFAADSDVILWEKTVTPPGIDGGDPISKTTMWNSVYRTKGPRSLIDITDGSMTVAYKPTSYTAILALANVETDITVTFPDGNQVTFYGYLKTFKPSELQEGSMPEATVEFVVTNWDPDADVEAGFYVGTGAA